MKVNFSEIDEKFIYCIFFRSLEIEKLIEKIDKLID